MDQVRLTGDYKKCTVCKQNKKLSSFGKHIRCKDGIRTQCKECHKTYQNKYSKSRPEKIREQHYRREFGITTEDYNRMLKEQNNQCMICKRSDNHKRNRHFHVDHCHSTGKVRGLLCQKCNMGLGMFDDNLELIKTAVSYLESNG